MRDNRTPRSGQDRIPTIDDIRIRRIKARTQTSDALAAVIAELALNVSDSWQRGRA